TLALTGSAAFHFDPTQFTLDSASLSVNQINLSSFLQLTNPGLTLKSLTRDSSGHLTGQIGVSAASAKLFPDKPFSASVTGLAGNYDLGTNAFGLTLDTFDLAIEGVFEANASGVSIGYDPTNTDPAQQLVQIDQGSISFPKLGITGSLQ